MKVFEYARAMGFDMIQGDHEDAPGQLELNWMYDDVLRNADRLSTYRQICAQVAREFNLIACFMTKPFMVFLQVVVIQICLYGRVEKIRLINYLINLYLLWMSIYLR
jgi:hypothetical protein